MQEVTGEAPGGRCRNIGRIKRRIMKRMCMALGGGLGKVDGRAVASKLLSISNPRKPRSDFLGFWNPMLHFFALPI